MIANVQVNFRTLWPPHSEDHLELGSDRHTPRGSKGEDAIEDVRYVETRSHRDFGTDDHHSNGWVTPDLIEYQEFVILLIVSVCMVVFVTYFHAVQLRNDPFLGLFDACRDNKQLFSLAHTFKEVVAPDFELITEGLFPNRTKPSIVGIDNELFPHVLRHERVDGQVDGFGGVRQVQSQLHSFGSNVGTGRNYLLGVSPQLTKAQSIGSGVVETSSSPMDVGWRRHVVEGRCDFVEKETTKGKTVGFAEVAVAFVLHHDTLALLNLLASRLFVVDKV